MKSKRRFFAPVKTSYTGVEICVCVLQCIFFLFDQETFLLAVRWPLVDTIEQLR